ncbi:MAG TPA: TetR/AcrR family transcriptional regulator [Steroidobacteraceae bacterium]|nr:TetR/AcrR family transcriptional regulator [Steroidobacteraceae bacterium]
MNPLEPPLELQKAAGSRVGRPRRGTESSRIDALIGAATRVFLREGYGEASIEKVAHEAGVSTRTIYERFKNKADLLVSVISRLVERDMATILATAELERMELEQALLTIGRSITGRACDPQTGALFRIVATEAQRFPALAEKMRASTKARVVNAVAAYFRSQTVRGRLVLADPDRAAALFTHMVSAELQECLLFGRAADIALLDLEAHVRHVVAIFLNGAAPRRAGEPGA